MAQDDGNLVARLNVISAGVEVKRVRTSQWVAVRRESLIGIGDQIRIVEEGRATLNFLDGVVVATLSSNAWVELRALSGTVSALQLELIVLSGFVDVTSVRRFEPDKRPLLILPAFEARVNIGETKLRVEPNGRSSLLTLGQSAAELTNEQGQAVVGNGSGVRAAKDQPFSDVIPARDFPSLDTGLDGCPSTVRFAGDYTLNVRSGAAFTAPIIGGFLSNSSVQIMGVTASGGWYRVRYGEGYGWISINRPPLPQSCVALRVFPNQFSEGGN
ncbi:MAG: hypothetical protein OHK0023_08400 [Anaerolineae bacterium]